MLGHVYDSDTILPQGQRLVCILTSLNIQPRRKIILILYIASASNGGGPTALTRISHIHICLHMLFIMHLIYNSAAKKNIKQTKQLFNKKCFTIAETTILL